MAVTVKGIVAFAALALLGTAAYGAERHPHEVRDARYGEALFYFYQQKYFSAITHLLAAQAQQRLPTHADEAELLLGGMYLSYGLHRQADRIFQALIDRRAAPAVRDRAWFYLAKIRYQRGYFPEAEAALAHVYDALPPELEQERPVLTALVLMAQARYKEAAVGLEAAASDSAWAQYARYNLGVARVRAGEEVQGVALLERVGHMRARDSEMSALKDKANLALGYAFLRAQGPERAVTYLQAVRLHGPFSSKALLGMGWAHAARQRYQQALAPWLELQRRDETDVAVQESLLAVPYALRQLAANREALGGYRQAVARYEGEIDRLARTIEAMQSGRLLISELLGEPQGEAGWFWRLRSVNDTPEHRYLLELLASHQFQETLKNYRDLRFLAGNLWRWESSINAFDAMLETRRQAYEERLPKIMESYRTLDLDRLARKRERYAQELALIERTSDAIGLATTKEQRLLLRARRVQKAIVELAARQDVSEFERKHELLSGLLHWQIKTEYAPRLWQAKRSLQSLDQALAQAQLRRASLARAQRTGQAGFENYGERIAALRTRIVALRGGVEATAQAHARELQTLVVQALGEQRERLRAYVNHARLGIAQIYDQSVSRAEVGR